MHPLRGTVRRRGMPHPRGWHLDRAHDRRSDRGERGQRAISAEAEAVRLEPGDPHTEVHASLGPGPVGIPSRGSHASVYTPRGTT